MALAEAAALMAEAMALLHREGMAAPGTVAPHRRAVTVEADLTMAWAPEDRSMAHPADLLLMASLRVAALWDDTARHRREAATALWATVSAMAAVRATAVLPTTVVRQGIVDLLPRAATAEARWAIRAARTMVAAAPALWAAVPLVAAADRSAVEPTATPVLPATDRGAIWVVPAP